jgi:hypothetical protein
MTKFHLRLQLFRDIGILAARAARTKMKYDVPQHVQLRAEYVRLPRSIFGTRRHAPFRSLSWQTEHNTKPFQISPYRETRKAHHD